MVKKQHNPFIPLSIPFLSGNEWKYIKECLDTGWVSTAGKYVNEFEDALKKQVGAKYAIAVNSGTSGLHTALKIVGVEPGDEVIAPTVTFIASINAIHYVGANPVFMDCDEYYNIDVYKVIDFIEKETYLKDGICINKKTKRSIRAIMVVHVFGNAIDFSRLLSICRKNYIKIVEDAAESLGTIYTKGRFKGRHTGVLGDVGCFSFNGNKIITTGGGGMLVTQNASFAKKAKYLTTQAKDDVLRFIHNDIGYNYRMTNIQAAMGLAQLEKLHEHKLKKKNNYKYYQGKLQNIDGLSLAINPSYADNNCWMYPLGVKREEYGRSREELIEMFLKNGIETRPLWYLNHKQKPYQHCGQYRIEKAKELYNQTLCLPCSVNLKKKEIDRITGRLKEWKQ